jgi:hypothetical protein
MSVAVHAVRLLVLAGLLGAMPAALTPSHAAGQRAPLFMEPGHWSHDAIRRLNGLGLAPPASDPALAPVTVQHAESVFAYADSAGRARGHDTGAHLAAGYLARLRAETSTAGLLAVHTGLVGWAAASGEALGGDGHFFGEDWEGAQPVASASGPVALWRGYGFAVPWLSWTVEGGWMADEAAVRTAVVAAAAGPFDVWAGRRRLQYGMGRGGAVVMGGAPNDAPLHYHRTGYVFDGVGIHVREPFHFPWLLRILGADRAEATLGRISRNGRVDRPWVAFGRLIGTPFTPRFTLGINRGAIFGGDGQALTAGRLLGVIAGLHGDAVSGFYENQVFSVMGRIRPPLGPLPLELYLEWGMDDTSGAVRRVPGIVAGLDVAAVPGLPALALGLERTSFAESCCGNPIWYRNIYYRGSWADEGRLFAHPLGGHGTEWLLHGRVDLPGRGVAIRAELFSRDRGHENLFSLERRGSSTGLTGSAEAAALEGTLRLDGSLERGDGWEAGRFSLSYSRVLGRQQD